jgi:hypothetical protein
VAQHTGFQGIGSEQREQQMLGADFGVVAASRLFDGADHGVPGSLREPFEHSALPRSEAG